MTHRMILALFSLLAISPAANALTLVKDGEPAAVIVLPDSPAPSQTLAADELQRYLARISGAKLPVVAASKLPADDARVRVHVGNSPRVAELGVKIAELPREGFVIKTVGNNLVLAGEDGTASDKATDPFHPYVRTGTLFAVYAFLEDELGVRWLWPGETGEVVPKQSTIKVGSLDRKEHPLLFKRQLRPTLDPRWIKAHKEEVSFIPAEVLEKLSRDEAVWLKRMRMGRGQQVNYGHAFTTWWQRYGQEHPEYFALQPNGQRGPHHPRAADTVKMCVSEPKLWDKLIEDFVAAHKLNPELVRSVNGCENDGSGGFCTCERCRGWDVPSRVDKGKDGKEYVVLSDRYCKFWNALGERLAKIAPEAWVTGYAYSRYRLAPVETRLRDNILTGFVGFGYPSTPEARQATREDWLAWAKAGTKLFLRPNALLAGHGMPYVYTRALAEDFVFCGQNGMRATDFDSLTGFWATTGPTYYVLAKLHWTPSLNVAKLLDDYYSHFGPAAKDVQAYFDFWEGWTLRFADLKVRDRIYELSPTSGARGFVKVLPEVYREEDFGAGRPFLERAKAAAEKGTPEHRQRVEHLRLGFEHARLTVRALAAASGTSAWKSTDVSEILQAARDLVAFRKRIAALNVTNVAWLTYNEIRLGDLTGIRMAAQVGDRQAVVRLTVDNWQFQWDPQKVGEKEQWSLPSHDRKAWHRMRVDMPWEQTEVGQAWKAEHGEDYNGIGWYACRFDVPAKHAGARLKIFFGAVDEDAKVWVNGQHVGDHPFVKPDDWKMPFEFDITNAVKAGAGNLVVVRVEDSAGAGGIYKPVWILRE